MPIKQENKVLSIDELGTISSQLRAGGRIVVLCHGTFDIMHFGHLQYFKQARTFGDVLFVTITADEFINKGPGRPLFSENMRAEMCAALQVVDFVGIVHDASALPAIEAIQPSVYVKGAEYKDPNNDKGGLVTAARKLVETQGGRMEFVEEVLSYPSDVENRISKIAEQKKLRTKLKKL